MIDRWATLGLPLLLQLSIPGGSGKDPQALVQQPTLLDHRHGDELASHQFRTAAPLIRTLLAKHVVHGVVWDGWSDHEPHVQAQAGLIDAAGAPRPMLDYLERLRGELLA
jgi:hypothetical protein